MKVCFVFLPESSKKDFVYHLGVAYIQAFLKKREIESFQFVPEVRMSVEDCVEGILLFDPDLVGFTVYDYNYYLVKVLSRNIKIKRKDLPIILGGPSPTFSDLLIMEDNPYIDVCVRGEGEETLFELCSNYLEKGFFKNLETIKGITYRKSGNIVRNEDRPLIRNANLRDGELDVLPSPFLEGILKGDERTGILTSRGCTFKCTYCNFTAMSRNRIRYHSVERVIRELETINETLSKKGGEEETITIYDDAFTLNIERAKEICRRIKEKKICFKLSCETRVDRMDDELLELMVDAGFKNISFGLESASPKVLRNIKKVGLSNSPDFKEEKEFLFKMKKYVGKAKELNLNPTVSIILGLPSEKLKDGMKSVKFVENLGVKYYAHNLLQIFPGTELFKTHRNFGIEIEKGPSLLPFETNYSYDVSKVPFGKNSTMQSEIDKAASIIMSCLVNSRKRVRTNSVVLSDIVIKDLDPSEFLINWLSKNSLILAHVVFLFDIIKIDREYLIKRMIVSGFPSKRLYFLRSTEKFSSLSQSSKIFELLTSKFYKFNLIFSFSPFHIFENPESRKIHEFFKVIYLIENEEDLKYMEEFLSEVMDKNGRLAEEILNFKGCFLNGCIFGRECPSLKMQKIVIDENCSLRSCFSGEPLGHVGEEPSEIQRRFLDLFRRVEEKRGCLSCPVNENCSRCPFLKEPLKGEYCRIRRKYPDIWKVTEFLEIASIIPGLLKE